MGSPKQVSYTGSGRIISGDCFVEKATLVGTGSSTMIIYDGVDANGRVIARLSSVANGADNCDNINEKCKTGCFARITSGAGLASGLIYFR